MTEADPNRGGITAALSCYILWGILPIYFKLLAHIHALELVGWRVLFSLPVCLVFVLVLGRWSELRAAAAQRGVLLRLAITALLVGANWLIYVTAVDAGHVLAASLGYYIIPLVNVVLGTALLGERLNRVQWVAVALATAGIALLLAGAVDMLGVALAMAITFALYGYVRKLTPVGAVPGLTIETVLLAPFALAVVATFARSPDGSAMLAGTSTAALLASTGVVTAVPLLLFAVAARKLDLTTLGFAQFISPTISFFIGVFLYGEPLDSVRIACFVLIWLALVVFSWDMLRRSSLHARLKSRLEAPA